MRCKTVLIVEDERDIRETLKELLEFEGYPVMTAATGKEALDLLHGPAVQRPCLILLDLMMPVMNGWEFLSVRQKDDVLINIPVVIVSAIPNPRSHVSEETEGVQHIKKPVQLESVLDFVRQYCGEVEESSKHSDS